jgi:hypothetical protein
VKAVEDFILCNPVQCDSSARATATAFIDRDRHHFEIERAGKGERTSIMSMQTSGAEKNRTLPHRVCLLDIEKRQ